MNMDAKHGTATNVMAAMTNLPEEGSVESLFVEAKDDLVLSLLELHLGVVLLHLCEEPATPVRFQQQVQQLAKFYLLLPFLLFYTLSTLFSFFKTTNTKNFSI